jgi:hypothetical protein
MGGLIFLKIRGEKMSKVSVIKGAKNIPMSRLADILT